ncbi:DJ-1 family glyoxalase III [Microbulbifer marinus]|uniref:4-methyl-5(B-hydroxyethyl)-thiazole monophosphate biosynthesis n=1 Tax=Microbulbifer marinus TaxID=658218 RepID=A0A1H3YQR6_9GAMM|nr:DJ-1 family glyoxalase III [Microbulbifer marinus]SEA13830.1 4-methyl-5(b-hydroxyethyl)-thiazole monophosphate biosynthesis [Microbulbifer marinus]
MRVLVPIADGSEEIEVVTLVDVLRRADADVCLASVMSNRRVEASRGVVIEADCLLRDWDQDPFDLIALPGGMPGAEHLSKSDLLLELLRRQLESGRWLGAICAAPAVVLGRNGLINGFRATCHRGFRDELAGQVRETSGEAVVVDRNLVTSQAPGTALRFALQLVSCLYGDDVARSVADPMRTDLG